MDFCFHVSAEAERQTQSTESKQRDNYKSSLLWEVKRWWMTIKNKQISDNKAQINQSNQILVFLHHLSLSTSLSYLCFKPFLKLHYPFSSFYIKRGKDWPLSKPSLFHGWPWVLLQNRQEEIPDNSWKCCCMLHSEKFALP